MAQVDLSKRAKADLERIVRYLGADSPGTDGDRVEVILGALRILETSPRIGRLGNRGFRELVIGKGSTRYVALYRYFADLDQVLVLAIRSQRESGFRG